ncbi:MAG: DUF3078 domain-containing protein [Bacteroidaceae bacterium]|nr:DUF3078 domain-containing protein [Bacteroidaceae bacterium]
MYRQILSVASFVCVLTAQTATKADSTELVKRTKWTFRADSTAFVYQSDLKDLINWRNASLSAPVYRKPLDAYCLRLVLPPTFYSSSVLQQFSATGDAVSEDPNLVRMFLVNDALAKMYVNIPGVVVQIDDQIEKAGTLRDDVHGSLTTETKLSDKVVNVDLGAGMEENVELVTRRPNFWKFPGEGSLRFLQNYFSDHWYKGGENSYAIYGALILNANYDNKQKTQWENRLEARLGFQTTGNSDKYHSVKPTDNLLRLTSKLGYRAFKTFYYTTQVQASTQLVPLYDANTDNLRTDFLDPLNVTVSVGMDYKFATKNNKFTGSVYMAPCSYDMRYVRKIELANRHGIAADRHAYHNFGPSITANYNWSIAKNVSWSGRIYWISNLSYTNIEWENTFRFSINKYLSAELYIFPKFDDSSKSYKGDHGYLMMKEYFSLGMNYRW